MLYTIAVILLILWLAGWLGFHILGGYIHILVILAVIALVMGLLKKAYLDAHHAPERPG